MNRRRKMTSANEKIINEYSKYAAELMRSFKPIKLKFWEGWKC